MKISNYFNPKIHDREQVLKGLFDYDDYLYFLMYQHDSDIGSNGVYPGSEFENEHITAICDKNGTVFINELGSKYNSYEEAILSIFDEWDDCTFFDND